MPSYVEVFLRALLSFFVLLGICRLVGTKFVKVIPVVLAALAGIWTLDRGIPIIDGLISLATWGILAVVIAVLSLKLKPVQNFVNGKPKVLIENNTVMDSNLKKLRMTASDMMSLLRQKDVFNLAEVEFAVLEADGNISVMKKSDCQPVTPKVAGISVQNEAPPKLYIEDGTILQKTVDQSEHSVPWLISEIQKQGAADYPEVFLAQVDAKDNVYVDLKHDFYKKWPNEQTTKSKLLLLASLKKTQADLENFAMETRNPQAKADYVRNAKMLQQVIDKVTPELKKDS